MRRTCTSFHSVPPQIDCRLNQTIYFGIHTKQANSQTQTNQHTQSQNQNTKFLRFFQNRQLYIYIRERGLFRARTKVPLFAVRCDSARITLVQTIYILMWVMFAVRPLFANWFRVRQSRARRDCIHPNNQDSRRAFVYALIFPHLDKTR